MKTSVNWRQVWLIAGTYLGTIIGSGFATGQEIVQFFTSFGLQGIIGCFITFVFFFYVGAEILNRGRLLDLQEQVKIVNYYTPKPVALFLEYFIPIFLFGVYVIMISGAGATLQEHYGMNPYVGRALMTLVTMLSVILGLKAMVNVIGNVAPVIVVVTIFVGFYSFFVHYDQIPAMIDFYPTVEAEMNKAAPNAILSGLLYPSYNMCVVLGVLAGMGNIADSKKECIYGGLVGSVALSVSLLAIHLALFAQLDSIYNLDIPSLFLASQISPALGTVFSIIILLGIFTTAAPLLWQTANRFVSDNHKHFKLIVIAICLAGYIGGLVPFGTLIGIIYPFTGYIGLVLLGFIIYTNIKHRGKEEERIREFNE